MALRKSTTEKQAEQLERRRERARKRYARIVATDPDHHKKRYRRWLELHPDGNQVAYRRALLRDPQFNAKKKAKADAKRIADGKPPKKKRDTSARSIEDRRAYDKQKYERNKSKIIDGVVRRQRERYATDCDYACYISLRSRMRYALRARNASKSSRTISLIGCSPKQLAEHIESQFCDGMSWENRSMWHVDHIIPVSAFDLSTEEGQHAAFHYTNLRPLWAQENQQKSDKPPKGQRRFAFGYVLLADEIKNRARKGSLTRKGDVSSHQPSGPV